MNCHAFGITHPGMIRPSNEDTYHIDEQNDLLILADGMGGHQAGEVASGMAVDAINRYLLDVMARELENDGEEEVAPPNQLLYAFELANTEIYERASANPEYKGMGTTLIVAWFRKDAVIIGHVGDVRGYLLRSSQLSRLTKDHSLVERLVEQGHIKPEDVRTHPWRSRIEKAVGIQQTVEPDIKEIHLMQGDRLLFCSDGLWDMISDEDIGTVLQTNQALENVCGELLDRALIGGGRDNVTIVVADIS